MKYFVAKNNQQLGLFTADEVIEMLSKDKIYLDDLALKEGTLVWETVGKLFENDIRLDLMKTREVESNVPTQIMARPKIDSATLFLILLVSAISLVIGVGLWQLKRFVMPPAPVADDTSVRGGGIVNLNFKELLLRANDLSLINAPVELQKELKIRGKVAIVSSYLSSVSIVGVGAFGNEFNLNDLDRHGFSKIRMATKPDEIETLIQINCSEGRKIASYPDGGTLHALDCVVSVVDYRNKKTIARQTFSNDLVPSVQPPKYKKGQVNMNGQPQEVASYIARLPIADTPDIDLKSNYDAATTQANKGNFADLADELARRDYFLKPDSNEKIRGKVAIVIQVNDGRAKLQGFDSFGEKFDVEVLNQFGLTSAEAAQNINELDTLIRVQCGRGEKLGKIKMTEIYSNKCVYSIVNFQLGRIFFQTTFEQKEDVKAIAKDFDADLYGHEYVTFEPDAEIRNFTANFPKER